MRYNDMGSLLESALINSAVIWLDATMQTAEDTGSHFLEMQ